MQNKRPKHLALHLIKLPLPGIVSILHRISGILLFLTLPILLCLLQSSLRSIESYTQLQNWLHQPLIKLGLLVLIWAGLHHLCAGLRFLAIDMHCLSSLSKARLSSKVVLIASLLLTAVFGVALW